MVGHYQCNTCGATMEVAGLVLDVTCPLCRFPMVPADTEAGTRSESASTAPGPAAMSSDSENAGSVAHLKVARPVRPLDGDAAAAPEPTVTERTGLEAQDQRLQKLEDMVATARQEAELIVEAARLRARAEGQRLLAQFQAQVKAQSAERRADTPTVSASAMSAAATAAPAGAGPAPDATRRAVSGRCRDRFLGWLSGLTFLYLLYVLSNWDQPAAGRVVAWSLLATDAVLLGRCLARRRRCAAARAPTTVPQPRETEEKRTP